MGMASVYFRCWKTVKADNLAIIIPPPNEVGGGGGGGGGGVGLGGGYTGFTLSVRPSVRLSVDDMVSDVKFPLEFEFQISYAY